MAAITVIVNNNTYTVEDAGWTIRGNDVMDVFDANDNIVTSFSVNFRVDIVADAVKAIEQEMCYA